MPPRPGDFVKKTPVGSPDAPRAPRVGGVQQTDFAKLRPIGAPPGYDEEAQARVSQAADQWMRQDLPWHRLLESVGGMTKAELITKGAPRATRMDQFVSQTEQLAEMLYATGQKERASELAGWLSDKVRRAKNPTAGDRAKHYGGEAVKGLMTVLDAPHKYLTRAPTSRLMGHDQTLSMPEWQEEIKRRAEKPTENPISWATWKAARIAGAFPATALAAPQAALNAGSDVVAGRPINWDQVHDSVTDLYTEDAPKAMLSLLDPTFLLTSGGSSARAAGAQGSRAALGGGRSAAEAKRIGATLEQAMGSFKDVNRIHQGTGLPARVRAAQNILRREGVPEKEIVKSFGAKGEYLGKGQMRVGDPFGRFQTPEIIPSISQKLGHRVELQTGTRLAKGVAKTAPIAGKIPGLSWTSRAAQRSADPTLAAVEGQARQVRALEQMDNAQADQHMKDIASNFVKDADTRAEISARGVDPEVQPVKDAGTGEVIGFERGDIDGAMSMEELSQIPDGRAQFDAEKKFGGMWEKRLQKHDLLEDGVRNPVTDAYTPREYYGRLGALEDVPKAVSAQHGRSLASKPRHDRVMQTHEGDKVLAKDVGAPMGEAWRMHNEGTLSKNVEAVFDPFDRLPRYQRKQNRRIAEKRFEDYLVQSKLAKPIEKKGSSFLKDGPGKLSPLKSRPDLGVEGDLARVLSDNFDRSSTTLAQLVQKNAGHTAAGRALAETLHGIRQLSNRFKKLVLLTRPGYFTVNTVNDISYMFALGINRPLKGLQEMGKVMELGRRARSGDEAAMASLRQMDFGGVDGMTFLKQANKDGIGLEGAARIEQIGRSGEPSKKALERLAGGGTQREPAKGALGHLGQKATRSKNPIGNAMDAAEDFAGYWNDISKLTALAHLMRKGENSSLAAGKVLDSMIDYSAPGGMPDSVAKWFVSFWTWVSRSPAAAAKNIGRRPASPILTHRIAEAVGEPQENEPRQYVQDRGITYGAGPSLTRAMDAMRTRMGGSPINPETQQYQFLSRDAFVEPYVLPATLGASLLPGRRWNPAPLMNSMSPGWGYLGESLTGRDMLMRRDMEPSVRPFSYRTPQWAKAVMGGAAGGLAGGRLGGGLGMLGGAAAGAGLSQLPGLEAPPSHSSLSRKFSSTVLPPAALWYLNRLVTEQQGQASNPATFGASRGYSPNTMSQQAHQLWSMGTGMPMYTTHTLDPLQNAEQSPDALLAQDYYKNVRELRRAIEAGLIPAPQVQP